MQIAFFGSSLVSAYWNGAATYYRGIIRALHDLGHDITFYEPDAWDRQLHRDIPDPSWARVVVYQASEGAVLNALAQASHADLIVKASGVGIFDDLLEAAVPSLKTPSNMIVFWDVDAPATLDRVFQNPADPFARLIRSYDAVFTYGGGTPVIQAYLSLGARTCVPIYNALDPSTHFPVPKDERFACDLGFLGNRLPDREARVEEFFLWPAQQLPQSEFILGGSGWHDKAIPSNIQRLDHIYTRDHNAFNSTPRAVLNVTRDSMVRYGFSPATRVFEAAGAGACIITDLWDGIEFFFEPSKEILIASSGEQVVEYVAALSPLQASVIGAAAFRRVAAHHTYAHRAAQVDAIISAGRLALAGVS